MQEGDYDIRVIVKDGYQATETTSAVVTDEVASRVTGSQAVVTPTPNPLVALYSVPPSSAGTVLVQFALAGDHPAWRNTDARAGRAGDEHQLLRRGHAAEHDLPDAARLHTRRSASRRTSIRPTAASARVARSRTWSGSCLRSTS